MCVKQNGHRSHSASYPVTRCDTACKIYCEQEMRIAKGTIKQKSEIDGEVPETWENSDL